MTRPDAMVVKRTFDEVVEFTAGYAAFIWPRRTRLWWALATLGLHAGIALMLGLFAFAGIMMLLTLSAWLVPSEPRYFARCGKAAWTIPVAI